MKKTKLDHYRDYFKCRHDGEVVLKAGEHAFFPSDSHNAPIRLESDGVVTNRFPSNLLLEQLGIQKEMARMEIIQKLRKTMINTQPNTEYPERSAEIHFLLESVIRFCEDPVIEKTD